MIDTKLKIFFIYLNFFIFSKIFLRIQILSTSIAPFIHDTLLLVLLVHVLLIQRLELTNQINIFINRINLRNIFTYKHNFHLHQT
jgi:hypothetical protein